MSETFQNRRQQLVRELKRRQLDCLLVTHPANWYYLTAFTGDSGALVVDRAGATLITDGRFTTQAKQESPGIGIQPQNGALFPSVGSWVAQRRLHRVGYDPQQWTVSQLKAFRIASGRKCRPIEAGGMVEALRVKKDAQELAVMRKAAILVGEVLQGALTLLKPGVREMEVAAEIEY
ncbi:MAG: aminopeptidase P family N-terminal domain-containing protein, partial [Candidatus Acidiferrum sp.]